MESFLTTLFFKIPKREVFPRAGGDSRSGSGAVAVNPRGSNPISFLEKINQFD